jgi:hypothetical protein
MMENTMREDQRPGSVSKRQRGTFFPNSRFILLLLFLAACSPQSQMPSSTAEAALETFTLPVTRTNTISPTLSPTATSSPTPTQTTARTAKPTWTRTATPTHWPTPTRGLPSTATLSPMQECPAPTHDNVEIKFLNTVGDYRTQILAYLRAYGDSEGLEASIEKLGINDVRVVDYLTRETAPEFYPDIATVVDGDLTGDITKETIVTIFQANPGVGDSIWGLTYSMAVFVIGCRDRKYQTFLQWDGFWDNTVPHQLVGASGIVSFRDLNANGIRDIVLAQGNNISQQGDTQVYYTVMEWNGKAFRDLLSTKESHVNMLRTFNEEMEFKDVDGNGTIELMAPQHEYAKFCSGWGRMPSGPQQVPREIYMWDGETFRFMWVDPGDPEYRFQAAFDGDHFINIALYDRSKEYYERAIHVSSLKAFSFEEYCPDAGVITEPDEPQRIMAYARFRLLELLVYLQKMNDAENMWEYLANNYSETTPGYRYASLANSFWEAYHNANSIDEACSAVRKEAQQFEEDVFGTLNYGANNPGPTLDTICPFHSDGGGE